MEPNRAAPFLLAAAQPEKWCCSGRCPDTNWGGRDRAHIRDTTCPPFDPKEIAGYIKRATKE